MKYDEKEKKKIYLHINETLDLHSKVKNINKKKNRYEEKDEIRIYLQCADVLIRV